MDSSFNNYMTLWMQSTPNKSAGQGQIEKPGQGQNIKWQNRASAPSEYELALTGSFEQFYEQGVTTAEEFAAEFNKINFKTQAGGRWTADELKKEMAQLGH